MPKKVGNSGHTVLFFSVTQYKFGLLVSYKQIISFFTETRTPGLFPSCEKCYFSKLSVLFPKQFKHFELAPPDVIFLRNT